MGYLHDVFISYPFGDRDNPDSIGHWVRNVFAPSLTSRLRNTCAHEPSVFLDAKSLSNGPNLDAQIKHHLRRSKVLVAVWSTLYFRRQYCANEWYSMIERKALFGGPNDPPQLIYPIIWTGDREIFPEPACSAGAFKDFSNYSVLSSLDGREGGILLTEFKKRINEICGELKGLIEGAPAWQPDWPFRLDAPVVGAAPMAFPTQVTS